MLWEEKGAVSETVGCIRGLVIGESWEWDCERSGVEAMKVGKELFGMHCGVRCMDGVRETVVGGGSYVPFYVHAKGSTRDL